MRLIMKTGSVCDEENDSFFYEENGKYYEDEKGMKEISKLQLAIYVSLYWSKSSISFETELKNEAFYATMFIPIYEDVYVELYEEGDTEEKAIENVNSRFDDFVKYSEKYEENIRRNEIKQLQNMHRFIFLPKDRKAICFDFSDLDFFYVEDNNLSFRDLAVSFGVPNDARADVPIFGYVEGNKLVFFKELFLKGQFEQYKEIINKYQREIAKYYGLDEYELYIGMQTHEEYLRKNNIPILDEYVFSDFIAYYPIYKQKGEF